MPACCRMPASPASSMSSSSRCCSSSRWLTNSIAFPESENRTAWLCVDSRIWAAPGGIIAVVGSCIHGGEDGFFWNCAGNSRGALRVPALFGGRHDGRPCPGPGGSEPDSVCRNLRQRVGRLDREPERSPARLGRRRVLLRAVVRRSEPRAARGRLPPPAHVPGYDG